MSLADYAENKVLELLVGKTAFSTPTAYVALFTAVPSDSGGGTECSGGSYARKSTAGADWNAASGGQISNANALTFATPTADWAPAGTPAVAFALFDASSAGNMLLWDWLGDHDYKPIMVDDAATDLIDCPAHGFAAGDRVIFTGEFGGTLPTGLSANTIYFVIASGLVTDGFKVSTTAGGSAVDITAIGSGMVRKVVPSTIETGNTVQFGAGNLKAKLF